MPKSASARADSILLRLDEYKDNGYLTHNIHPYPAKFIPQIPREIIARLTEPGAWVLDPFCGSGTSLAEAALLGRNCVGTDINPLSCKISRAKAIALTASQLTAADSILQEVSDVELNSKLKISVPRFFGLNKWFSDTSQTELAQILGVIQQVKDAALRNFLEVVFSAIVVKASNQESDTRYKAIEKNIKAGDVRKMYCLKLRDAIARARDFSGAVDSCIGVNVWQLDSTSENAPSGAKFDLAITSPPYMNSYDYYLYHKHRMNWLGLDVGVTQEKEFGSRNKHNDKGLGVEAYNEAVSKSILLTKKVLRRNGLYCVIVGDAIWRGNLIRMDENYDNLFNAAGYRKVRQIVFPQRKYTRSFTANLRTQHKDSYVLIYAKE